MSVSDRSLNELVQQVEDELGVVRAWRDQRLEQLDERREAREGRIERQARKSLEEQRDRLAARVEQIADALSGLTDDTHPWVAPWSSSIWKEHKPPKDEVPSVARFGEFTMGALGRTMRTPAVLPVLGETRNLVVRTSTDEAREAAISGIHSLAWRLLLTIPVRDLRLLLFDPAGNGRNLAPLAQIGNEHPDLVGERIWCEERRVEEQIDTAAGQFREVIQTYLQGRYDTIEDYNRQAGDIAEPYRVIVALDYPYRYSGSAVEELSNIARDGPEAGMFVLLHHDTRREAPHGVDAHAVANHAHLVQEKRGIFQWQEAGLRNAEIEFDEAPKQELVEDFVARITAAAEEAGRVEVGTDRVLPDAVRWDRNSADGVAAPLGEAGPDRVLKMHLGEITQKGGPNALMAGGTGSGKSNLFHVIIHGLAHRYSPEELRLYLLDFKGGVEFKPYHKYSLPHAEAIALGCSPEFGATTLEDLTDELKRRQERFRAPGVGVTTLAAYRAQTGETLPRIVCMIDEFQRLFNEERDLAEHNQDLLETLARQGRAHGIHLFLSSQTLTGEKGLRKETMEQVQVRIALMMDEDSSQAVLARDNLQAAQLERPGHGIYNPNQGAVGGNETFQAPLMQESEIEERLETIRDVYDGDHEPVVFEGEAPARIEDEEDHPLLEDLSTPANQRGLPDEAPFWLGEPMKIADPVGGRLYRRVGRNLLIVHPDRSVAATMFQIGLLGVASRHDPDQLQILASDFTVRRADDPGIFEPLVDGMDAVLDVIDPRRFADQLDAWLETVQRRTDERRHDAPTRLLALFGFDQARDFRGAGELYGEEAEDHPSYKLQAILEDGPPVGVHVVLRAGRRDSVNTEQLGQNPVRHFGLRVAGRLSDSDSRQLLQGSGIAASLRDGTRQAVLADESDPGRYQIFRPYVPPAEEWLVRQASRVGGRTDE